MSLAEDLTIYKDTETLAKYITSKKLIDNFPKSHRYVVYPRLVEEVLQMVRLIYHANKERQRRQEYLEEYLACLETLKAMTRICHEGQMMTHRQCHALFEMYDRVGKQANGWRNSAQKIN